MRLSQLSPVEFSSQLRGAGLRFQVGPFVLGVRSPISSVIDGLRFLYADYPLVDSPLVDFHLALRPAGGVRRWWRPQALFYFDDHAPFLPLPLSQALPFFEWGLNWCVATYAHQYLLLHAAVVEKHGQAIVFPAPPGSGKSTLCAGLVGRGWRLLSDELAIFAPETGMLVPMPRPISLKNASISVIRDFVCDGAMGPECRDTAKGTVAHLRVPAASLERAQELAMPAFFVLPRYVACAPATLTRKTKGQMFMSAVENAFNYSVQGKRGFDLLCEVIDRCECYEFQYGHLDEAIAVFDGLVVR